MIAETTSQTAAAVRPNLLVMRKGGGEPPLFVVHGLLCDPGFANLLAKAVPDTQPVYSFEPVGMNGRHAPLTSIQEIAAGYIKAAEQVLGSEPFSISGYCAGSLIALEMAQQFTMAGKQPKHLFMIDITANNSQGDLIDYERQQLALVNKHLAGNPYLRQRWPGWAATVSAMIRAVGQYQARHYEGPASLVINRRSLGPTVSSGLSLRRLLSPETPIQLVGESREDLLARGMPQIAKLIAHVA